MIFNILKNYPASSFADDVLTYHRIVEAFKFAYAKVWLRPSCQYSIFTVLFPPSPPHQRTQLADPCCRPSLAQSEEDLPAGANCRNDTSCDVMKQLEQVLRPLVPSLALQRSISQ